MEEGTVRMQAQLSAFVSEMYAVVANVEGMRADNEIRASLGQSLAWDGSCFFDAQAQLEKISTRMREEIFNERERS